jgi:hypothetical protein
MKVAGCVFGGAIASSKSATRNLQLSLFIVSAFGGKRLDVLFKTL